MYNIYINISGRGFGPNGPRRVAKPLHQLQLPSKRHLDSTWAPLSTTWPSQTGLQAPLALHLDLQTALQAPLGLHLALQTNLQAQLGVHLARQTDLQGRFLVLLQPSESSSRLDESSILMVQAFLQSKRSWTAVSQLCNGSRTPFGLNLEALGSLLGCSWSLFGRFWPLLARSWG